MPRNKRYIDTDVYAEAKKRIHHVFDIFDTIVVMFSGGKDSLATLHLCREVQLERGDTSPLNVVFRDEELIPQVVIDFVDGYRRRPWISMRYFAVPLLSTKYVLGIVRQYVQWDKGRAHIRKLPDHAITTADDDPRIFTQYAMDDFTATFFSGKIAFVNGIRAAESLIRFQASCRKLNENYITSPPPGQGATRNVKLVKPIFDWEEDDVFRYFYEKQIPYCPIYDTQLLAGSNLRVATPLHQEAAKRFDRLKRIDPTLYEQVIEIWPEMLIQERYFKEFDRGAIVRRYEALGIEGVREFILAEVDDPGEQAFALKMYEDARRRHASQPDSYPSRYVLQQFINGAYKRGLMPKNRVSA